MSYSTKIAHSESVGTVGLVLIMSGASANQAIASCTPAAQSDSKYVKLNVGGTLHLTTIDTLCKQDTMLRAMFSGRMDVLHDVEGESLFLSHLQVYNMTKLTQYKFLQIYCCKTCTGNTLVMFCAPLASCMFHQFFKKIIYKLIYLFYDFNETVLIGKAKQN